MIPESVLKQLHYVKVDNPDIDLRFFSDFMIVGPQRTGTTWLSANLRSHPQIMMTVPKELHFFDKLDRQEHPQFRSDKLDWYLAFFQESSSSVARKRLFCLSHYGEPYRPIVRGEATPSYAYLHGAMMKEIAALNPQIRIIMMIRDPVDRAWSHAKRNLLLVKGRKLEEVADEEFEEFFSKPYQRQCAQYVQNIDRWLSYIDEKNLFIGWFDDLQKQPTKLLLDVMSFLGVKSDKKYTGRFFRLHAKAREVMNATASIDMPPRYRKMLESLLKEEIKALAERFGPRRRSRRPGLQRPPSVDGTAGAEDRGS